MSLGDWVSKRINRYYYWRTLKDGRRVLIVKKGAIDWLAKDQERSFVDYTNALLSDRWASHKDIGKDISSAVITYRRNGIFFNNYLRKHNTGKEWVKNIEALGEKNLRSKYTVFSHPDELGDKDIEYLAGVLQNAIKRARVPEDIVIYRGISKYSYTDIFGDLKEGDNVTCSTFWSASLSRAVAEKFSTAGTGFMPVIVKILVRKNSRALYIGYAQDDPKEDVEMALSEREVLFPIGARFKVIKIGRAGRAKIIDAVYMDDDAV